MVKEKVLLISVLRNSHRNLGCLSLFAHLAANGIEVKLIFIPQPASYRKNELQQFIRANNFTLVGISVMTDDFNFVTRMTGDIRECSIDIHVIWGGIHPTLAPEECLEHADSVCVGEGEETLLTLIKKRINDEDVSAVSGLGLKLPNGDIKINPPMIFEDLDAFAFSRYDWQNFYVQDKLGLRSFDAKEYLRYSAYNGEDYTLMATRGCPFSCNYCVNSFLQKLYKHGAVRKRSVDHVLQEIKYAIKYIGNIKFINFIDDQFLTNKEWNEEFTARYKKEIGLPFIVRVVPGTFTDKDMKVLKNTGLMFVRIGIQSGCAKTNKDIFNRRFNRDAIIESSRILTNNKVYPFYDIIIQNDFETDVDRDETIKLLLEMEKPYSLTLYALTPYPGTSLERMYKEKGIKPRTNPYEKGYCDYDEDDFYFQFASVISYTPNYLMQYAFTHSKNKYIRLLLKKYYQVTKNRRKKVITAQAGAK